MEIVHYTKNNKDEVIKKAISVLQNGGLIVYPTETTYGMGADATNQAAIDKLFSYKEKREGKPLSIAVADKQMAEQYAEVNEVAENLYSQFLPGPITIVSTGKHSLANGVESQTGTIGVRIPNYDLVIDLVRLYKKPITATSANASYQKRPYSPQDILDTISNRQKDLIDLIIDAGELPHNDPSTVVDTTLNTLSILRQGNIVLTDFETYVSHSEEETVHFGGNLLERYKETINHKPIIIALQGEMGAGKTHLVKGVAAFLDIQQTISSPTFTLEEEYAFDWEGKHNKLQHLDTWRMFSKEEFDQLHIEKHIAENNVLLIEWAEKVYSQITTYSKKAFIVWVKINILDADTREILFSDSFIS